MTPNVGFLNSGGAMWLTGKELSVLRAILGFIEAGEISGGPLEGMKPQETTANVLAFKRLMDKAARA